MNHKKVVLILPLALALVLLAGWLQLVKLNAAAPVSPSATFNVNSTVDATDVNPGDGMCETAPSNGICTLRAAIQESNALAGADSIVMPAGVFTLTITGREEDAAATGDLDVTDDTTLTGAGPEQSIINVNALDRGVHILLGTVEITNLTIRDGFLSPSPSNYDYGGGIHNNGVLTLNNTFILSNTTNISCGSSHLGAGLSNLHIMTITNSLIDSNFSECTLAAGGGIFNGSSSTLFIENSTLSNNHAGMQGGGIYSAGQLQIENSTIAQNFSWLGGGFYLEQSTVSVIVGSNIIGNEASTGAAVHSRHFAQLQIINSALIDNYGGSSGEVLWLTGGSSTTISNTTVSNRTFTTEINAGGTLKLVNATLITTPIQKSGGTVITTTNSIFAGNVSDNCYGLASISIQSLGYNISDDDSCNLTGPGDLQNTDPLLDPLESVGTTWIHPLQAGSPAIDGGTNDFCPNVDQRGVPRPLDGNGDNNPICDIGAFEFTGDIPFVSISDISVIEGNIPTMSTAAMFTLALSFASTQTVSVTYTTIDGTAHSGSDYIFTTAVIEFLPGQITYTIPISILGDIEIEPDETFIIELSDVVNGLLGDDMATGTILNDDEEEPGSTIYLPLLLKP